MSLSIVSKKQTEQKGLIYCATPSRLSHKTDEIVKYISQKGFAPLHPFNALPFEYFEGNPNVGREKSMEYCVRLIDCCDFFGLFGISKGTTTIELPYAAMENKPILLFKEFDKEWEKYAEEYVSKIKHLKNILK